jgi:hypothetical protein
LGDGEEQLLLGEGILLGATLTISEFLDLLP